MIRSMTAFSRAETGSFSWEIRSVNQRFTDISFRMPENYRALEPELRRIIKANVNRGKLECSLRIEAGARNTFEVNAALVESLNAAAGQVASITGGEAQLATAELLRWPGVIVTETSNAEDDQRDITNAFTQAIAALVNMREAEGESLAAVITEQLAHLTRLVDTIAAAAPGISAHQRSRLATRLAELEADINQERFEQEVAFLLQKSDIQEEIDRLRMHMEQVREALAAEEPIGRRLDFLMQELNREANTLSAKATAADTSLKAVDMKVVIEQMREQVQNIE